MEIQPIVLAEIEEAEGSLLSRFFRVAGEALFAVVIVSPDHRGAAPLQSDDKDVGEKSLKFRARQIVILELGFFYGKLGFQDVYVLISEPKEKWPDFELTSDLAGAVFKRMDPVGKWKLLLKSLMNKRGFKSIWRIGRSRRDRTISISGDHLFPQLVPPKLVPPN